MKDKAKNSSPTSERGIQDKEEYMRRSLFWLGILVYIVLPVVNHLLLQTVNFSVDGNIAYGNLSDFIATAQDIISAVNSYAGLGILVCAVAYFGLYSGGTAMLAFAYQPVILISSLIAYKLAGGTSIDAAIYYFGVDALANLFIYAVIYGVLFIIRYKKFTSGETRVKPINGKIITKGGIYTYMIAATAIFGGAQLASKLYTMIDAFVDPALGPPINVQEVIYWITEYLSVIVYTAIGYFIIFAIAMFSQYSLKHFSSKVKSEDVSE